MQIYVSSVDVCKQIILFFSYFLLKLRYTNSWKYKVILIVFAIIFFNKSNYYIFV